MLFSVVSTGVDIDTEKLTVMLRSDMGKADLWEECDFMPLCQNEFEKIVSANEVELVLDFRKGNYASTAFGTL